MHEIPYETLKERAKRALDRRIGRCDPSHGAVGFDGDRAVRTLVAYALLDASERAALRTLAQESADRSPLGQRARSQAQAGRTDWSQWLQRVRRRGHRLIDRWDVRCVAQLLAHFPECVTARQRRCPIACRVDDATGEWVVAFTDAAAAPDRR